MNKMKIMQNRRRVQDKLAFSNRKANAFVWHSNETDQHIQMKLEICKWLKKQGKLFYTEAKFIDGGRADVINADDMIIYEVMNSEKEESIKKKAEVYPYFMEIRTVQANQEFEEKLIL